MNCWPSSKKLASGNKYFVLEKKDVPSAQQSQKAFHFCEIASDTVFIERLSMKECVFSQNVCFCYYL